MDLNCVSVKVLDSGGCPAKVMGQVYIQADRFQAWVGCNIFSNILDLFTTCL